MTERSLLATGATGVRSSPLRGRYLARNPLLRATMLASDLVLAPLRLRRAPASPAPRRVLLAIGGHLGDAVIATAAIGLLSDALPDAEIGVLVPRWSAVVLDGDPRIRYRHQVDHWFLDRGAGNLPRRWWAYRISRRRALAEMRAVGYDAAVDLYDHFPNAALLLWRAGIPVRVGFDAAGFTPLYTHAVRWPDDDRHVAERQALLLRTLVPTMRARHVTASLPPAPADVAARVDRLLADAGVARGEFIVLHPGAGAPVKEWPAGHWRRVAEGLSATGATLVFTGQGPREHDVIRAVMAGLPRCVDLCDRLDWASLVQVIRLAQRVVSVDTVAAHVAGAVGTPAATLWTSPSDPHHWGPLGATSVILDAAAPDAVQRVLGAAR